MPIDFRRQAINTKTSEQNHDESTAFPTDAEEKEKQLTKLRKDKGEARERKRIVKLVEEHLR